MTPHFTYSWLRMSLSFFWGARQAHPWKICAIFLAAYSSVLTHLIAV